ncbi:MAG: polyprenol monophosphomannose synthase [Anaerolineae bacterium]|nr:polyprenol monophosphomannose synthase [Anaerolineae bacterium]
MTVYVVVPTYNEAENLTALVGELLSLGVPGLRVLVVDDASPDGTGAIADGLAAEHPRVVEVMHRAGKMGLGTAYVAGFQHALRSGADYVVQMDADFSHSPAYIPSFIEAARRYDVVIGSRYVPGGSTDERWSFWRYLLSWWANQCYSRLILGLQVRDATAGFKCFRRAVLETIDLSSVGSSGYIFQVEMAYLCQKLGFSALEVPIHFEDRRIGRSKMSVPVKLEAAWRVWQIRWRYRHLGPVASDEPGGATGVRP